MTREQAKEMVLMLAATWPRPPVEAATVHAYAFALADLELEAANAAVLSLMQTSKFFPTVAEIRERAIRHRVDLPAPEEAWGIVRREVGRLGAYRIPVFDCDEIQDAVDVIGWREICLGENEAANRARYIDAVKSRIAKRMHLEATGAYVIPDRQLPENTEPRAGDARVRVTTGYGTVRPELLRLQAMDAERALRPRLSAPSFEDLS